MRSQERKKKWQKKKDEEDTEVVLNAGEGEPP